uniref:Uncharacterized protein n=1 Tax=Acrobeloides nanus TaxID=290746 RepID=A0A914EAL2_9BILA
MNPGQINNTNISDKEISFMANVGPLGFQTYFVSILTSTGQTSISTKQETRIDVSTKSITNERIRLDFDDLGYLSTLHDLSTGQNYSIRQEFFYYHGHNVFWITTSFATKHQLIDA